MQTNPQDALGSLQALKSAVLSLYVKQTNPQDVLVRLKTLKDELEIQYWHEVQMLILME